MILLTVGTQLPFDRLVEAVDRVAPDLTEPVIAQVGVSEYRCKNIEARKSLAPREFEELFSSCSKIISHAGIGTILNAQKLMKPILIVPRRASFGEHRNDHQLATCRSLRNRKGIYIVEDASLLTVTAIEAAHEVWDQSSDQPARTMLMDTLRGFVKEARYK